jgi:hypothetical protein
MVYPALLPLMRTTRLPAVDWTDAPRWYKWTRPFRRKTKSGFCACAITFQTQSNTYCCSTITMVTLTLTNVALYVQCLALFKSTRPHVGPNNAPNDCFLTATDLCHIFSFVTSKSHILITPAVICRRVYFLPPTTQKTSQGQKQGNQ